MSFRAANRFRVDKVRATGCFSAQPLLGITRGVTWVPQQQPKNDRIKFTTEKHGNTSKVSLLYLFYRRKGTIQ